MPALHFETAGNGRPLLFLPGLGLNRRLFDHTAEALKQRRSSILVDLPGTGRTPSPGAGHSVEYDARLLLETLTGFASIDIVAHSRGVKVALALSSLFKNIGTAILVGGAAFGKNDDAFRRDPLGFDFGKIEGGVETLHRLKKAREGSDTLASFLKGSPAPPDYRKLAAELTCGIVFIAGEHDPFLADIKEAMDCYPGSTLRIIRKAGHFPMIENAGEFNAILSELL